MHVLTSVSSHGWSTVRQSQMVSVVTVAQQKRFCTAAVVQMYLYRNSFPVRSEMALTDISAENSNYRKLETVSFMDQCHLAYLLFHLLGIIFIVCVKIMLFWFNKNLFLHNLFLYTCLLDTQDPMMFILSVKIRNTVSKIILIIPIRLTFFRLKQASQRYFSKVVVSWPVWCKPSLSK